MKQRLWDSTPSRSTKSRMCLVSLRVLPTTHTSTTQALPWRRARTENFPSSRLRMALGLAAASSLVCQLRTRLCWRRLQHRVSSSWQLQRALECCASWTTRTSWQQFQQQKNHPELHPALQNADLTNVGVFGHSMG